MTLLNEAFVDEIRRIAREEIERAHPHKEWMTAKEVVEEFGFSKNWVYAHAYELGGRRFDGILRVPRDGVEALGTPPTLD